MKTGKSLVETSITESKNLSFTSAQWKLAAESDTKEKGEGGEKEEKRRQGRRTEQEEKECSRDFQKTLKGEGTCFLASCLLVLEGHWMTHLT